jgi:hypothetical protein
MPASGLDVMIDLDKTSDLARMYRLFGLVPEGLPTLKRAMKATITARGRAINDAGLGTGTSADAGVTVKVEDTEVAPVKDSAKAKLPAQGAGAQTLKVALKWVEDVLTLKDKFDGVLRLAFQSDRELESGINEVGSPLHFVLCTRERIRIGIRVVYQFEREVTRVHFIVHRRPPEEGLERRKDAIPYARCTNSNDVVEI